MITINTIAYKFFGFNSLDKILFLNSRSVYPTTYHVLICLLGHVCECLDVGCNFSILKKLVIQIDDILLNVRQITYSVLKCVKTFLRVYLLFLLSKIDLFIIIYSLYSFINDILLYLLLFKCFYLVCLLFIVFRIFECRFSFHEFSHEKYIGGD
jgi:hypothetical protein